MNEEKINLEEHNEDAFVSIKEKKKKISLGSVVRMVVQTPFITVMV